MLEGFVGGSGGVRGGYLIANEVTYVGLDGACSDSLEGLTQMTKSENCSGGDSLEVVAIYISRIGGIVKSSTMSCWF